MARAVISAARFAKAIKRSALSIARGNGKTTLCGWLAAAVVHPDGPLRKRNARVVVAAASHEQGAIIHKQVLDLLPDRDDKETLVNMGFQQA